MTGRPGPAWLRAAPVAGLTLLGLGLVLVMSGPAGDLGAILMILGGVLTIASLWLRQWRAAGPVGCGLLVLGPVIGAIAASVIWAGMPAYERAWIAFYGPVALGGATLIGMALAALAWLAGSRHPGQD